MAPETMFVLNERLKKETIELGKLELSLLLLMNDRSMPWLILVPQRPGLREIVDLSEADRALLMEEIAATSRAIQRIFSPEKINVGALGNIVTQLHIHVIGRSSHDRAWPGPVWGTSPGNPYRRDELKDICKMLSGSLNGTIQ